MNDKIALAVYAARLAVYAVFILGCVVSLARDKKNGRPLDWPITIFAAYLVFEAIVLGFRIYARALPPIPARDALDTGWFLLAESGDTVLLAVLYFLLQRPRENRR